MILLRLFDDALRDVRRDFLVVIEFHAEDAAPLRDRAQVGRVALHFSQRHEGGDDAAAAPIDPCPARARAWC